MPTYMVVLGDLNLDSPTPAVDEVVQLCDCQIGLAIQSNRAFAERKRSGSGVDCRVGGAARSRSRSSGKQRLCPSSNIYFL